MPHKETRGTWILSVILGQYIQGLLIELLEIIGLALAAGGRLPAG